MASSGKMVTAFDKVAGIPDPATSQPTVAFPAKSVEIAFWMRNLEGHQSITMNPLYLHRQLAECVLQFRSYPRLRERKCSNYLKKGLNTLRKQINNYIIINQNYNGIVYILK